MGEKAGPEDRRYIAKLLDSALRGRKGAYKSTFVYGRGDNVDVIPARLVVERYNETVTHLNSEGSNFRPITASYLENVRLVNSAYMDIPVVEFCEVMAATLQSFLQPELKNRGCRR